MLHFYKKGIIILINHITFENRYFMFKIFHIIKIMYTNLNVITIFLKRNNKKNIIYSNWNFTNKHSTELFLTNIYC